MFRGPSEYERLQQKAVQFADVIKAAGGTAVKEGRALNGLTGTGWFINLSGGQITDELVEAIIAAYEKDPVFELNLSRSNVTDEQLKKLDAGKVFQKVVILDLSDTAVSDTGLDNLTFHFIISELNIKGSKATAAGAKRLGARQIAHPQTPQPFKKQPKLDI